MCAIQKDGLMLMGCLQSEGHPKKGGRGDYSNFHSKKDQSENLSKHQPKVESLKISME